MSEKKKKSNKLKNIIIVLAIFAFLIYLLSLIPTPPESASNSQEHTCNYKYLFVKTYKYGTDKVISSSTVQGCFSREIIDENTGLLKVSEPLDSIKLVYYLPSPSGVIDYLDVFYRSDEPTRFRRKKGDDIFVLEKNGNLTFIFSDKKKTKTSWHFTN